MIPRSHTDCYRCILGGETFDPKEPPPEPGLCEHHRGPGGEPVLYEGFDAYEYESCEWIRDLIGKRFRGPDVHAFEGGGWVTRVWTCFGYDPRNGFWLRAEDDGHPVRLVNVSERAIGRTFHRIHVL